MFNTLFEVIEYSLILSDCRVRAIGWAENKKRLRQKKEPAFLRSDSLIQNLKLQISFVF